MAAAQKPAAAKGGIGANGGKRLPSTGGRAGKPAPAGNTGAATKGAFGLRSGSSKAMGAPKGHIPGHTFATATMPRMDQKRMANPSTGDEDNDSDAYKASSPTDDDYTMGTPTSAGLRQTGASDYLTPDDVKKSPSGTNTLKAVTPTKSREMAATQKPFPKKGIIKPSKKGDFTAKAKSAGMSVQAYANSILSAKKGTHPPALVKQANFARNFGGSGSK